MGKVLLVDDDVELSSMLSEYIAREGFDVDIVRDGETGVGTALSGDYSIVVLDVMMPKVGGIEALRRIRGQSRIPVLMLTARGDDVDRIVGLELGADDYVPKPCTPRELVARIRAILRRSQDVQINSDSEGSTLAVGPLVMWPQMRRTQWHGRELGLTSTEYNLLEILARSAGRVVSKAELSEQGLGRPLARFDRSIDVHLSSIRHKLGPRSDGRPWIETVRGLGYQLIRE